MPRYFVHHSVFRVLVPTLLVIQAFEHKGQLHCRPGVGGASGMGVRGGGGLYTSSASQQYASVLNSQGGLVA